VKYVSTRGGGSPQTFSAILLEGLAADGGLYVPASVPQADLAAWRKLAYPDLAFAILREFMDDIPDLEKIVRATYTKAIFGSDDITPLKTLEPGLHLLGLSSGPTLAFKDVALQLLGRLFENVLQHQKRTLNILGATSGDTGSAAEHALRGRRGIQVFMLSPEGRMSPFQRAQMYSLQDANIHNIAIRGVFDDCQDLVKQVNADAAFKARHHIGAVNSINWARVAAQVVYYFKGYFAATHSDAEKASFAVPSGNFGNIYAGHVARAMGLPVQRLILASNENDVLDEFFRTGTYRIRKSVHATSSPSMDISKASNFERYVHGRVGPARVLELWRELDAAGEFRLAPPFDIVSGRSTHADRLATIRRVFKRYGVMIDPHTADGVKVGLEYRGAEPLICLETAQPVKFAETLREALGRDPGRPKAFEGLEERPQRVEVMAADAAVLKRYIEARSQ
jgi:threonine synthase